MRKRFISFLRVAGVVAQYLLTLLFIAAGAGMKNITGTVLWTSATVGILFYTVGLIIILHRRTSKKTKRVGLWLAIVGCIPTLPVSIIGGFPARSYAVARGALPLPGTASSGQIAADSNPAIKRYYSRGFLRFFFYLGLVMLGLSVILLATKHYNGFIKTVWVGFLGTYIGYFNRKPRMVIMADALDIELTGMGTRRLIPLKNISSVSDGLSGPFQIMLKEGKSLKLAKFEFSKETRKAFAIELKSRIS